MPVNQFSVFTVTTFLCILQLGAEPAIAAAPLAFTHVTVIDGTDSNAQLDMTVVVTGDRIVSVNKTAPPKSAQVIDAAGKVMIPGLWDMHVHIAGVTADPKWSRDTLLPLLVANGITGIRDMGGDLDALQRWRADIAAGKLIGPHIVAAGPMLDRGKAQPPDLMPVMNADDGRAAVVSLKTRGADFIKVLSRLDRDSYFAIADESKKQGLAFVGHVPDSITAIEAIAAGQKSIEHIMYSNLAFDCSARETELRKQRAEAAAKHDQAAAAGIRNTANDSFDTEKANALCRSFNEHETWLVPTLIGTYAAANQREASARFDDPRLRFLPNSLRKKWTPEEIAKEVPASVADWYRKQFENDLKVARFMHNAGVKMMAGSDSLDPFNFPGNSLHEELALLVRAGFTPIEALQAATFNPARFLNADHEGGWGTIQPDRRADLVLLDADPLADIANTQKISAVVLRGRYFDRKALDQMLADARVAANAAK